MRQYAYQMGSAIAVSDMEKQAGVLKGIGTALDFVYPPSAVSRMREGWKLLNEKNLELKRLVQEADFDGLPRPSADILGAVTKERNMGRNLVMAGAAGMTPLMAAEAIIGNEIKKRYIDEPPSTLDKFRSMIGL